MIQFEVQLARLGSAYHKYTTRIINIIRTIIAENYVMALLYYIVWGLVLIIKLQNYCQICVLYSLYLVIFFLKKFGDEDDKVFYCIRAPKHIFETYRYLVKVSDACNWSCEQQGTIPQSTR